MRKIIKQALATSIMVFILLAIPLFSETARELDWLDFSVTASAKNVSSSGSCGDNVTYTYNSTTKELVISGSGAMNGYSNLNHSSPFYDSDIKSVKINSGVTRIGRYTFENCSSLQSITIPDSVTYIDEYAFKNCTSLESIAIPSSVKRIYLGAFSGCSKIERVYAEDIESWLAITFSTRSSNPLCYGADLYFNNQLVTELVISDGITSISEYAFSYCTSLQSITVDEDNPNYASDEYGVLYNKNKTALILYPIGNSRSSYTIPNSVTSIGDYSFGHCTNLISVTIGDSVTIIDSGAFSHCTNLTSVTIGDSVTIIDSDAFSHCTSLTEITIPDSVTNIAGFSNCTSLTSVVLGDSVTSIASYTFRDCTSLTEITIPNSVTSIGSHAFDNCMRLTSVILGDSVKGIDYRVFYGCTSLTSITIPDSAAYISEDAFYFCTSLTSVTIGDGVKTIGWTAFGDCIRLASITIGNSISTIDNFAFEYCTGLAVVYYTGTEEQWNKISIRSYNSPLINARIHYLGSNQITNAYKRKHVINNWADLNQSYKSNYLAGLAVPMDGTNGNPNYLIPGQNENMIPQGLTYWPEKDWVLVSSYDKSEENPSAIFALDRETGAFVAQFNLKKKDSGKTVDWKPHAGGIGVSDNNLYITCGNGVAYFPLSDLDVESGTVKDIVRAGYVIMPPLYNGDEDKMPYTAYISVSDGMLWAGNFYSDTTCGTAIGKLGILPESWFWKASDEYNSIILGYKLSGSNSKEEWANLKKSNHNPKHIINVDNEIDCIQGIAFKKMGDNTYKMYLSRTTDASFSASITTATVTLNKKNITLKENKFSYYKNLPGTEGIVFIGDDLHILYESGALSNYKEFFNQATWNQYFKDCTDVIWKVNEGDLLQIPQVDGSWFENSAYYGYNHELAQFCADYCVLGYNYNQTEVGYYLNKSGFSYTKKSIKMNAGRDEVNYFIADKTITVNGVSKNLIFVGCIGSYKDQWYSNFDPLKKKNNSSYTDVNDTDGVHLGFADARDFVYKGLKEYIAEKNIDTSNAYILLTGHSRGSATVNLLAAKLIDDKSEININSYRIYTYGFATPNTALRSKDIYNERYESIRNIVNPEDLVTKLLPYEWGYGRYGTTYTLPSKTNVQNNIYLKDAQKYSELNGLKEKFEPYKDGEATVYNLMEDMNQHLSGVSELYDKKDFYTQMSTFAYFRDCILPYVAGGADWMDYVVTGATLLKFGTLQQKVSIFFLNHQKIRSDFEDSHLMQTYVAYIKTMTSSQITAPRSGYKGSVNCPVDVEIYDKTTGELVGRIVNNVIDEEIAAKENSVVMSVDGDSKQFWLPSNGDYDVRLIGNDEGTMDYILSEVASDVGEVARVNFFDVGITDSKSMAADIASESFVIDDYVLGSDEGAIESAEVLNEDNQLLYDINVSLSGFGFAGASQTVKSGDYVSLEATACEGDEFLGWYENDELVSTESTLAFVAKSNRSLTVKFNHTHKYEETITAATCTEEGLIEYKCICGDIESTETIPAINHINKTSMPQQTATCSEVGYTEGVYCPDCETWLEGHEEIELDSSNHVNTSIHEQLDATCTEYGYSAGTYCSDCGEWVIERELFELNPANHINTMEQEQIDATCTENGYTAGKYCFDCEIWFEGHEEIDIDSANHINTMEQVQLDATCTEIGYTVGKYCSDCETWFEGHKVINATGHSDEDKNNICDYCESTINDILIGETKTIEIKANEITYLKFIPYETAKYTFTSLSNTDTYGYLYDADKKQLAYNDDGGSGSNFSVTSTLTAGETYYWGARFYSSSKSGSFDVTLTTECIHENFKADDGTSATCTSIGYTEGKYCSDCETWFEGHEEIPATNHSFHLWVYDGNSTCVLKYICQKCNFTKVETPSHTYQSFTIVNDATCFSEGLKSYCCSRCGTSYDEVIPKIDHEYSSTFTVDTLATCSAEGSKSKHCTRSGCTAKTSVTTISATGHSYGSYKTTKSATCTVDGTKQRTCSVCGNVETASISKLGHNYSSSYTVDKKATCTSEGSKSKHCTRSGCTAKTSVTTIAKIAHTEVDIEGKTATCTETGLTAGKKCSVCGTVILAQSVIAKKAHTYKTTTTKATLSKNGKVENKCSVCSNVNNATTIYYPKSIKLSATSYTYNGKTKTPSVTVKDSKGKTLKKNTDYTVKYSKGRKSIGKYTVTVTFKGNYSGTKKLTFEIVPAKVTLSKLTAGSKTLTATWKTVSSVTGYEVQYSTSSKFTSKTTKTVKIKSSKTKKTTIKKLTKGKKYYVRIRAYKTVSKKPIYGAWSSVKNVKVK